MAYQDDRREANVARDGKFESDNLAGLSVGNEVIEGGVANASLTI